MPNAIYVATLSARQPRSANNGINGYGHGLGITKASLIPAKSTPLSCAVPQLTLTEWALSYGSFCQQRTPWKWPIRPKRATGNVFIFVKSILLWAMRATPLFKVVHLWGLECFAIRFCFYQAHLLAQPAILSAFFAGTKNPEPYGRAHDVKVSIGTARGQMRFVDTKRASGARLELRNFWQPKRTSLEIPAAAAGRRRLPGHRPPPPPLATAAAGRRYIYKLPINRPWRLYW